MKSVAIITMHRIYNYGSILQSYATQRLFEEHGFSPEIIDYISPYRAKVPLFLEYPPRLEKSKLKRTVYYIAKVPSFVLKDITFGSFIRKHLKLTNKSYLNNNDLVKDPPHADIYVSGSDQVWNSKYNHGIDGSYYLNFVDSVHKYSFVSSFGRDELSDEEANQVEPMLRCFASLSVREQAAVSILAKMGLHGCCLIDPTLQISKEEWLKLANKRLVKEKYLLLFLLYNEDNGASEYARRIADNRGLKLVKLSWEMKCPETVDKLFTHRSPQDFLSLFGYADFVVTNSFHGVAFSINLNKQFAFVPRSEFNGRIESLLSLCNLANRRVTDETNIDMSNEIIEYSAINEILKSERLKAADFLDKIK